MTTREIVTAASVVAVAVLAMIATLMYTGAEKKAGPRYHRMERGLFMEKYQRFIDSYTVETIDGIPVVEPPPDSDIFVKVYRFGYEPLLRLHKGGGYTLHLYSLDTLHGFSLPDFRLRYEVPPGQEMVVKISPPQEGKFAIICDEFCGQGHHDMHSLLTVLPQRIAE